MSGTAVQILGRRITASVLLVRALGGGWDSLHSAATTGVLWQADQPNHRRAFNQTASGRRTGEVRISLRKRQPCSYSGCRAIPSRRIL